MREGSLGAAAFVTIWLAIWTVACVFLAREALAKRQPVFVLFAIPFWASWIFVFVWLLKLLLDRRTVSLDRNGLVCERGLPALTTRRFVPLEELRGIESRVFHVDSESGVTAGLEIQTFGRSVVIGTALPPLERDWVADWLDRRRRRLQADAGLDETPALDPADCRECAPPSDGTWTVEDDFEGPSFVQRGRLDVAAVLCLLFITVFWNGIVGVFVAAQLGLDRPEAAPRDFEWWATTLFLAPFVAIGLVIFVGWLAAVTEPFRTTRWEFRRDAVARVTTRAGLPLGWNRRFPHDGLDTAAVRGDLKARGLVHGSVGTGPPTGTEFGLLVTDAANVEVCTIHGLTFGDARWMKGRLQAAGLVV